MTNASRRICRKDIIMKKITKFLLVVLIVTSMLALSSCSIVSDIAGQVLPDLIEMIIPDGVGELLGITVTEAPFSKSEWMDMATGTNFSMHYVRYVKNGAKYRETNSIDGKYAHYDTYRAITIDGELITEIYDTAIDGDFYTITNVQDGEGFIAQKKPLNDSSDRYRELIHEFRADSLYNRIKYDGGNKYSTKYMSNDWITYYEFEYENGKITKLVETQVDIYDTEKFVTEYWDIGTTVVELPEYTEVEVFDPDRVYVGNISYNDFCTAIDSLNYSLTREVKDLNGKVTDIYNVYQDASGYNQHTVYFAEDGSIVEDNRYYVKVDGNTYDVYETDIGYVGVPDEVGYIYIDLLYELENLYKNLVYDEALDVYTTDFLYYDSEATFTAVFNGKDIDSFSYEYATDDNVITASYYDIGTTVVNVPDFTAVSCYDEMTWLISMGSDNYIMEVEENKLHGYEQITDYTQISSDSDKVGVSKDGYIVQYHFVDGVWYEIVYTADGYIGMPYDYPYGEKLADTMKYVCAIELDFDDFTYNEYNEKYMATVGTRQYEIVFDNSEITIKSNYAEIGEDNLSYNVDFTIKISAVGLLTVFIPDYVVAQ